jgi:tripartite-type tricarboxylate transporter receptor subunit TctC
MNKVFIGALLAGLTAMLQAQSVHAQAYPTRVIRLVIPYPPGGGHDALTRAVMDKIQAPLGQPLVMEHRPGAGGNIGTDFAARSAPDGHTLFVGNISMTTAPAIWAAPGFDPVKDFVPITKLGSVFSAMAVNPGIQAKNVKELIALSKARPLNFATPSVGSSSHLIGEMMNAEGIMKLVHIPYKGTAPAVTDAMGGQVDAVMVPLTSLMSHIRAGKLRGIAVLAQKRVALMPDLPTFVEAGYPNVHAETWYGLFAPAGTPAPIVRRLHELVSQALSQADVIERLQASGYEVGASTPEALGALVTSEVARWGKMAADAKIQKQ